MFSFFFVVCSTLTKNHIIQVFATVKSGSIAIAASTLDSLLDLMAGGVLWFTHLSMKRTNIYKYPIGKLRMQPVGITIFAAIMATLGMLITYLWFSFLGWTISSTWSLAEIDIPCFKIPSSNQTYWHSPCLHFWSFILCWGKLILCRLFQKLSLSLRICHVCTFLYDT